MRTRIVLSVLLVLVVAFFLFIKPKANENNVQLAPGFDTTFRVGAWDNGWVRNDYTDIKELGLNVWHKYSLIDLGWWGNIGIQDDIRESTDGGAYTSNVRTKIDMNFDSGFVSILDRCKISYLGLAKRSVYECEKEANHFPDPDYWFYGYSTHDSSVSEELQDNSSFGNGVYVRHSSPSSGHTQGYIVKGLMANREQIWMRESKLTNLGIFVLPRIRIDTSGYNNYDTTKVCRIEIVDFFNNVVKDTILRKSHFARKDLTYHGEYVDKFKFNPSQFAEVEPITIDSTWVLDSARHWIDAPNCYVDYRVWWYGECEMWLDNITVENEIAYNFFHDNPDTMRYHTFQTWLDWEVQNIAVPEEQKIFNFHFDEPEFCSLPALAKINREIKRRPGGTNIRLVPNISYYMFKAHIPDFNNYEIAPDKMKKYLFDSLDISFFNFDNYPFNGYCDINGNPISKVPTTLTTRPYNVTYGFLAEPVSPTAYDYWLQTFLDGSSPVNFVGNMKYANTLGKSYGINFIPVIQAHLNSAGDGRLKEPSNEEISVMTNLAISYGAKGIEYFAYMGYGDLPVIDDTCYNRGFVNLNNAKRDSNVYGQLKWESSKNLIHKIRTWGPDLMSFNLANTNSYIYRFDTARTLLNSNSYFIYFATLKPGTGTPDCGNQEYTPDNIPQGFTYDCADLTYLQIATFENSEPNTKYFMVVNRRCSPYINENSEDNRGGKRKIRAVLHSDYSAFSAFKNWSIVNCYNDSAEVIFKTHNPLYVELGWFMPGEGKLYKIVPITETGGTLVGDEYVNSNVTIKKSIYNNGYNITFGTSANVSFEDSAGIYMNGGVLKIGNASQTYGTNLQFKGITSNNKWQGLVLEECDTVLIYGTTFSNILPNQSAINLTNCYHFKIMNNLFTCGSNENSGGIYADYSENPEGDGDSIYQYIGYNVFSYNESSNNVIQVVSTAIPEIPLIIEGNQFNTGAGSVSSSGIFLSNITGGAIKHNEFTNYINGIILVSSSCDFFENLISSNQENTKAIQLKLGDGDAGPSQGYFTGGYNEISTLGSGSMNIDVANSYFNIDEGYNVFDIDFSNSQRHISGYFPSSSETEYKAGYNCFKNNSSEDTASIFVTQGNEGNRITFNTSPTYCSSNELQDYQVFSLPGGINDTVYYRTGGSGGGYKDGQAMAIETVTSYKYLRDSININIRKRNYILTESQCKQMLLAYPDSNASISAISKLYLSSLLLDSAGNHIQTTKTFYENLILNNPNNTPLIKRANYFVQKCKVALKQYASALQGFQEIINQNPYSYEGLIASWDYAATTLLMGSGSFNEQSSIDNVKLEEHEIDYSLLTIEDLHEILDSLRNKKTVINSYTAENYDQKKFTKLDREMIKLNVENAFSNERTKQIEKLKNLENKITTLTNTGSKTKTEVDNDDFKLTEAKRELKTLKTLGEVVKVKKPKNIIEQKIIINTDIKKVFGTGKISGNKKSNNFIPETYNLSQNYPNPFNPVTKINYELPKDGRVKLVIYDILGREIKTLVNELKQAGRYTIEFNGDNYASGVYFYRIQVEGGKNYTAVKKMVLIK